MIRLVRLERAVLARPMKMGLVAGPLILSFFLAVVRTCQRDLRTAA